ncbi:UDP-glucuronosyltransferase 2B13 [Papilio machaon]|uniref:UDP-glucuronosyltransferase 2B13 n=1 Tax=Papilio machaon TaxID=76193 RepID=A0A194RQ88_PAPMA|nr:UDP-glucuronosyltransferase 2B13 [Papilio machaon]
MLSNKNVQHVWKTTKFDIVVTEQFNSDCSLGLAHHLKLPVIGLASHALMPWHYSRFGVSFNPSYVSHMFLSGGTKPKLYERIERVLFDSYLRLIYKFYCQRIDQNTLAQYFDDIPPLEELGRNIKFQLVYSYFVHFGSSLYPQNVIEVGGYHVQKPKKLPDDIRKFIEESQHGVIYISFGSMLRSATTPREKIETIISALRELPQRFIWKWEEDSLPGNPSNIYLSKWLPQNDILNVILETDKLECVVVSKWKGEEMCQKSAKWKSVISAHFSGRHPNVLAFYSHCGLLGTSEALYHGVPMLAMPIFGDQPGNAAAVEESGLGVKIEFMELTKKELLEKFKQILNPEFRAKVKILSQAWKDRPISGIDAAIHWTEFAARYPNFTYRSAAADVPLYQYLGLDILLILFGIPLLIIVLFLRYIFNKKKTNSTSKNKHKSKKE